MNKISTFRDRLKEAINESGMSQSDLARAINCNRSKISYYLSGRNEAKDKTLFELARILDVNPAWLEGYDVPMRESRESELFYTKLDLLNSEGRRKVEEYIDDLLDNPKYKKYPAVMLPKVKTA